MIECLSEAVNLRLYVRDVAYKAGPAFFRPDRHSVRRFADAARAGVNADDLQVLERLVRVSLDLAGGASNRWVGVSLSHFGASACAVIERLDEAGVIDIVRGIPDPNSHEIDAAAFPSPSLVEAVWNSLPPSM